MVSLLKLAQITEEGVRFLSPHDGTPMYVKVARTRAVIVADMARLLTPEHSISLQNSIGSDIIMQLDDVIVTTSPDLVRMKEAMERSVRWLDRCIKAHKYPERQNLFCIIQGGLDLDLRRECTKAMVARDTPGVAIGGLSGGEAKDEYCKVVDTCTGLLPEKKPRYVMGVVSIWTHLEELLLSLAGISGRPSRLHSARRRHVRLRVANKDCCKTRSPKVYLETANTDYCQRFGNAITDQGVLNIRNAAYAEDSGPIEEGCRCVCCRSREDGGLGITRAYIYHVTAKETAGAHLLTMHNVHYQLNLMQRAREAIIEDRYPAFLRDFFAKLYDDKSKYPGWAVTALRGVGVDLLSD